MDLWSADQTKASLLGITAHWINADTVFFKWTLQTSVIAFQGILGSHSGDNIGWYFVGLCEHSGLISVRSSKAWTTYHLTCIYILTVTTSSPCRSGQRTETVQRSKGSWLQRTKSSVAAHTAAWESQSAGIRTEQAREEGDASNWEQQRKSCSSQTTSVGFGQGVGHLPVSITWVGRCRRWEDVDGSIEVVLDEEGQGWVSWGKSETGHGQGQTITRSIEGDYQTGLQQLVTRVFIQVQVW